MAAREEYDVVVIGAGPVGENVADYAIRGTDRTAALVEAERFGGECSYWACMPSKALLRPLDVAAAADHLGGLEGPIRVDREALLARRDAWVSHYQDAGQVRWVESAGIVPVRGTARVTGEREVTVTGADGATRILTARQAVVVATGSVPVVPEQLAGAQPWTTRDATGVREVPDRLVVVGGGVAAVESARWMTALGSAVTLVVRGQRLLAGAEPFAGEAVATSLRDSGVQILFGTEVSSAVRETAGEAMEVGLPHGGPVRLELVRSGAEGSSGVSRTVELTADEVLVATGRRPALDGLGLEVWGIGPTAEVAPNTGSTGEDRSGAGDSGVEQIGAGHAGSGQTGADAASSSPTWLHRVGDSSGEAPLTHWGKYRARLLGRALQAQARGEDPEPFLRPEHDGAAAAPVPQVVFTDPQVTWVGPTAAEARRQGLAVEVREVPFTAAAGSSLLRDDATGTVRLVSRAEDGVLVGATFVGPETQELIHSATVAITGGMTLAALGHAVPSYPTASEVWLRLLESEPVDPE